MTCIAVWCPHWQREQIVKREKTGCGTQQSPCQNTTGATGSLLLDYRDRGQLPAGKYQFIARSHNASGVRDAARVLQLCTATM